MTEEGGRGKMTGVREGAVRAGDGGPDLKCEQCGGGDFAVRVDFDAWRTSVTCERCGGKPIPIEGPGVWRPVRWE